MEPDEDKWLQQFYDVGGPRPAAPGNFTLNPDLIKEKLGGVYRDLPQVAIAQFLRTLHHLEPGKLSVKAGRTLTLVASDIAATESLSPDATLLSNLILFLQASPYENWQLQMHGSGQSWTLTSDGELTKHSPESLGASLRLQLEPAADAAWRAEVRYLQDNAPWLTYPLVGLTSDTSEAFALGRFGTAEVPAFSKSLTARIRHGSGSLSGRLETTSLKEAATSLLVERPIGIPTVARIEEEKGESTVRFFTGGALTAPMALVPNPHGIRTCVVVYAPDLPVDSTGLRAVEGEAATLLVARADECRNRLWADLESAAEAAIADNMTVTGCVWALLKLCLSFFLPFAASSITLFSVLGAEKKGVSAVMLAFVLTVAITLGSVYVFNFWTGAPWLRLKKKDDTLKWLQTRYIGLTGENPRYPSRKGGGGVASLDP